jgi:hypothetical protein
MKLTSAVLAVALAAASPALAQDTGAAAPPGQPASGLMPPIGHLDVRLTGSSTMFLSYVGAGINADYALLALGPLALTVGGELSYDSCFLGCLAAGVLYGQRITDQTITPAARVTLHFPLGGLTQQPVDVYLVGSAGLLIGNHSAEDLQGQWAWRGTAIGPSLGGGFGGNYFWGNVFFTGTEITVAYTAYTYTPEFTVGNTTIPQEQSTYADSHLLVRVFLGLRF